VTTGRLDERGVAISGTASDRRRRQGTGSGQPGDLWLNQMCPDEFLRKLDNRGHAAINLLRAGVSCEETALPHAYARGLLLIWQFS
jgi:hypothetical protein